MACQHPGAGGASKAVCIFFNVSLDIVISKYELIASPAAALLTYMNSELRFTLITPLQLATFGENDGLIRINRGRVF
jgi:hypothetical protein